MCFFFVGITGCNAYMNNQDVYELIRVSLPTADAQQQQISIYSEEELTAISTSSTCYLFAAISFHAISN